MASAAAQTKQQQGPLLASPQSRTLLRTARVSSGQRCLAARHAPDPPGVPSASSREEMNSLLPSEAGVSTCTRSHTHTCAHRHKHTHTVLCLQCAHVPLFCEEFRPMTHIWCLLCPQTPAQQFAPGNTPPSPPRDETLAGTAPGPGLGAKARHRPAAAERPSRPRKAFWRRRPRAALWLSSCRQRRGPAHRTRVKCDPGLRRGCPPCQRRSHGRS